MPTRPAVVAFDMFQTVFSLEPLRVRLTDLGLPGHALELWFARTLGDGFALAAAGSYRPFLEVARGTLAALLVQHGLPDEEADLELVLGAFAELPAHPDSGPAMARLRDKGVRILALTNGSSKNTSTLLKRTGLDSYVEQVVSIDDARAWKPRPELYQHAAQAAGCDPGQLALVATHAWDCHGAARAGLTTAWVSRIERRFNPVFGRPDVEGDTLPAVSDALLALPGKV